MTDPDEPKFDHFQKDIERHLTSIGMREKRKDGSVVLRGYDTALEWMFDRYLSREAFDPLIAHFRRWNWEYTYNDRLLALTDALVARGDWPRLERLWSGVIAKRRKLYNDLRTLRRLSPDGGTEESFAEAADRLRETLARVRTYAFELGRDADGQAFSALIDKVDARRMI